MPPTDEPARERRLLRSVEVARTPNACDVCREKKVKCSGERPCSYCDQRSLDCIFSRPEKRRNAYSSQLRELQDKVARFERQAGSTPAHASHTEDRSSLQANRITPISPIGPAALQSSIPRRNLPGFACSSQAAVRPAPATPGRVVPASALSSTDTFGSEVRMLLVSESPGAPVATPLGSATAIEGWPAENEASEMLELVVSHVGISQQLFDIRVFADNMSLIYTDVTSQIHGAELFIAQMCLIFAIGRLLQAKPEDNGDPPGARFFDQAMGRMPTSLSLRQHYLLGIEVSALTALYLQITDRKLDAHLYSNMALDLAISHNLHTNGTTSYRPEEVRRNRLWWSIYMQNRRLCAAGGYPTSIEDHAISMRDPFDAVGHMSVAALMVNTQTARATGRIMSAIYSRKDTTEREFTSNVQSILRTLHDIETTMPAEYIMHFESSWVTVAGKPFAEAPSISARTSAGLYISIFSAVIYAVRPVLLYMGRQNRNSNRLQTLDAMNPSLVRLGEICVETSFKMLVILKQLQAREILAKHAFLDLDATFSVGFVSVLIEAISPGKKLGAEGIKGCRSILLYLADLGNRAAASRLSELEQMCTHLAPNEAAGDALWWADPAHEVDIGLLTQPFSFSSEHRPSDVEHHTRLPHPQAQTDTDPSPQQAEPREHAENDRRRTDPIADLASIPLDDIDSLYGTYHPSGLSFTGVELADWITFEQELFWGM